TLPFWIYMIGIFLVVIYFKVKNSFSHNYIGLLGTYSLAVYFFHALLLQFYVPIFDFENHHYSFFGYFLIIASLFLLVFSYVSLLYILVKKTGKKFPVVKFLLGI
ncbi:MAG: hypothetical protein ACK5C2_11965, partial [Bacteroidota bacterium]